MFSVVDPEIGVKRALMTREFAVPHGGHLFFTHLTGVRGMPPPLGSASGLPINSTLVYSLWLNRFLII